MWEGSFCQNHEKQHEKLWKFGNVKFSPWPIPRKFQLAAVTDIHKHIPQNIKTEPILRKAAFGAINSGWFTKLLKKLGPDSMVKAKKKVPIDILCPKQLSFQGTVACKKIAYTLKIK